MPTIKQSFDVFEIMLTNEMFDTSVPLNVFNTKRTVSKQKKGSIQSLLSARTKNLPVPFLIQTSGMLAKASIAAVQNAIKTVVEQQPQVVVNSAMATGGTAVGGVVWVVHDQFKTERQIQSNERFASEDRRSAELQNEKDRVLNYELRIDNNNVTLSQENNRLLKDRGMIKKLQERDVHLTNERDKSMALV